MEITTRRIKVKDLIAEYFDDDDGGVKGYGGQLTIRPPYQREFVYDLAQQEAVINSILKGYPLGEMYWAKTPNGNFEIIDGQQRTVSICRFAVENAFSVREGENLRNCDDLAGRDDFMDYDLTVHVCEGDDDERLDWFKIINSHGEPLNDQELLNATYSGEFVSAARRKFKAGMAYMSRRVRQELRADRDHAATFEMVRATLPNRARAAEARRLKSVRSAVADSGYH